ncbi:MAG: SsrA-binding protein SmpB [Ignavibacteria bacterium]|nr:SsrA-binding protein SmpB [Ignavibacteria bacterium]MBK6773826.1 SsrA-binding protein SmpB [Ignavibacteria bacterium]MBK7160566.1 SsrA-binding protein SmpB [Ignavibacteria bacterium]MBK7447518.1 SsrA-binding protein SmpB [Ignavibacteria bacterium]
MSEQDKIKIITSNRKANFEYSILSKYEAGVVLFGTEVKSLRDSKVNIQDSYGRIINDEVWLINASINEYKFGNINNHDPLRNRKLLLNKREIRKIKQELQEKGLTLVPLKIYFKGSKIKIELGIAKGKKLYDKRESIKKRETERKLSRL